MLRERQQQLIQILYDTGHFENPENPTGVLENELQFLTINDEPVKIAVRSYQNFFNDQYHTLTSGIGIADGELNPATVKLLELPRCSVSDFVSSGVGSWPKNCNGTGHAITVRVSKAGMPSFLSSSFEQAWDLCAASYDNMGLRLIREDTNDNANILMSFERLRGSTIGLAIVGRNQTCRTSIWAKFSPTYNPKDRINQWARLLSHELGHNMGMGHSRGGIMNPSIVSGPYTGTQWRGDPNESILRRYFGGIPNTPPTPEPEPPKGPNDEWWQGSLNRMRGDEIIESFILIPRPKV